MRKTIATKETAATKLDVKTTRPLTPRRSRWRAASMCTMEVGKPSPPIATAIPTMVKAYL